MRALAFLCCLFIASLGMAADWRLTGAGPGYAPLPFLNSRIMSYCTLQATNSTVPTCVGENAAPTVIGTSAVYTADPTTFARTYVKMTTKVATPTSGDSAGYRNGYGYVNTDYAPIWIGQIATPATITTMRIWAGMVSADISSVSTSTTNSANRILAFGYDTGGATPVANWQVVTCDGTGGANTCSASDTGVAVTASHEYRLTLDFPTLTVLAWKITDVTTGVVTSGTKTTTLPATDLGLGWMVSAVTLASAQREVWLAGWACEHN